MIRLDRAGRARRRARRAARVAARRRTGRVLRLRSRRAPGGRGGRAALGRVTAVEPGRRQRRARARRRHSASVRRGVRARHRPCRRHDRRRPRFRRAASDPMQIDVFTLVPHAFAWITEQRPSRPCSATSSSCASSTTAIHAAARRAGRRRPLRRRRGHGAARGRRRGGARGCLRPRAGRARDRVHARGRQLDQALVEELATEPALTLLSSRFEGFDERVVEHLATDTLSIGPYVLSGGELPAMVLARRRGPPSARSAGQRGVGPGGELLAPSSTEEWSTRTTRARRSSADGACRRCCSQAITGGSRSGDGLRAAPVERVIDPYGVLGVGRDASPEQIDVAYRRAAGKAWSYERRREIDSAYELLAAPERRAEYDAHARAHRVCPRCRAGAGPAAASLAQPGRSADRRASRPGASPSTGS